jgi:hypothetical protein
LAGSNGFGNAGELTIQGTWTLHSSTNLVFHARRCWSSSWMAARSLHICHQKFPLMPSLELPRHPDIQYLMWMIVNFSRQINIKILIDLAPMSHVCTTLRRREIDNRRWFVVIKLPRSNPETPDLGPLAAQILKSCWPLTLPRFDRSEKKESKPRLLRSLARR